MSERERKRHTQIYEKKDKKKGRVKQRRDIGQITSKRNIVKSFCKRSQNSY